MWLKPNCEKSKYAAAAAAITTNEQHTPSRHIIINIIIINKTRNGRAKQKVVEEH